MRKISAIWLTVLAVSLVGCTAPPEETAGTQVTVEDVMIPYRNGTEDGKLVFLEYTRYTGGFVEDGSGDPVEDVAAILVQNTTSEYLQYSQLVFRIGDEIATFQVTGLPPGARCWVLEADRLQIGSGQQFSYVEGTTSFVPVEQAVDMSVELLEGSLIVRNHAHSAIHDVYVYYKQVHEDGDLLGGITYRCSVGSVEPESQKRVTAGHSDPGDARVVRIECSKEEQEHENE